MNKGLLWNSHSEVQRPKKKKQLHLFFNILKMYLLLIRGQLSYNTLLVSTILPHEQPQVYICPSLLNLPPTSLPIPLAQVVTEYQVLAPCITQQIPTDYFIYGNVYISILFSQFTPPFPSASVSKVCSLCLHLHCGEHYGDSFKNQG